MFEAFFSQLDEGIEKGGADGMGGEGGFGVDEAVNFAHSLP